MTTTARVLAAAAICCIGVYAGTSQAAADGDPKSFAPPASVFSWTGYYAGVQLGGLANFTNIDDPLGHSIFGNPNIATGAFAGGQVGYNYQSGSIVYGLEADLAFPETRGTSTCSSLSGQVVNSNCRVGIDAFGTLTGRLGYALGADGRSLIYGKAGAAWYTGDLHTYTNDHTSGGAGNPFTTGKDGLSHWGWTVGAGADYAMTGNWSLRAEYDYARFGDQSVGLLPTAVLNNAGAVVENLPGREGHASNDLHTFKLGLNYRFDDHANPADAPVLASLKDAPGVVAANAYTYELGARYWYSWGRNKYDLGHGLGEAAPGALISRLTYSGLDGSTGEAFGRVNAPWNLFAKGFLGGGTITGAKLNDEDFNIPQDDNKPDGDKVPYTNTASPKGDGEIPWYGTIDVGYDWWRAPTFRLGTFVGYNYYREQFGVFGCRQTVNQTGPCGMNSDGFQGVGPHPGLTEKARWQSMRLGAAAEFELLPGIRLSAEAAYLPYVTVGSADNHFFGDTPNIASINLIKGHGVGTQLEAMLTYDVTDQWSVGLGGRYWAMWSTDASEQRVYPAVGGYQNVKIETERAGLLGQIMYKFD